MSLYHKERVNMAYDFLPQLSETFEWLPSKISAIWLVEESMILVILFWRNFKKRS